MPLEGNGHAHAQRPGLDSSPAITLTRAPPISTATIASDSGSDQSSEEPVSPLLPLGPATLPLFNEGITASAPSLPSIQKLAYFPLLSLCLSLQIGSGIFSAPSVVAAHVTSPPIGTLTWAVGGLLCWTGALSFVELGTTVPENGGIQEYLRCSYGDVAGFCFSWMWIVVVKPCNMAMVSLVFAEYLYRSVWPDAEISLWILKPTALLGVAVVTVLNCVDTRTGVRVTHAFMTIKVIGLASIGLLGPMAWLTGILVSDRTQRGEPGQVDVSSIAHRPEQTGWDASRDLVDALFAVLFSYGGWESISFIVGEMDNPLHNLSRVLNHSMGIVISFSVLASISFYIVLPLEELKRTNAIALEFGRILFGQWGELSYALIVSLSCLGALHATVFSMGRLTQMAGARLYLPAMLKAGASRTKPSHSTIYDQSSEDDSRTSLLHQAATAKEEPNLPINAMVLNACLSIVYVLVGTFRALISFKGMSEYIFYFATVSSVFVFRRRTQEFAVVGAASVYHTSLINPISFCAASAMIVLRSAIAHPMQVMVIVLFLGCGTTIYRLTWWQRLVGKVDREVTR